MDNLAHAVLYGVFSTVVVAIISIILFPGSDSIFNTHRAETLVVVFVWATMGYWTGRRDGARSSILR